MNDEDDDNLNWDYVPDFPWLTIFIIVVVLILIIMD